MLLLFTRRRLLDESMIVWKPLYDMGLVWLNVEFKWREEKEEGVYKSKESQPDFFLYIGFENLEMFYETSILCGQKWTKGIS